jgi:hypothetical protein
VITFCKKNQVPWSFGRAKKQLDDGTRYLFANLQGVHGGGDGDDVAPSISLTQSPTLTCNGSQIIREGNATEGTNLTGRVFNELPLRLPLQSADTLRHTSAVDGRSKLSGGFRNRSVARDNVLRAVSKYPGWVKYTTIAAEIAKSPEAVRKQLRRLARVGVLDRDGQGHYRKRHQRQHRKLKPCRTKPIPKCLGMAKERQTLSRTELLKRGWPLALIDEIFFQAGRDHIKKEICTSSGRIITGRFYWTSRVKAVELLPWFEIERANILHHLRAGVQLRGRRLVKRAER